MSGERVIRGGIHLTLSSFFAEVFITAFMIPILYKDKEQAANLAAGADVGDSAAQMKMTLDNPELKAALSKVLPGFDS